MKFWQYLVGGMFAILVFAAALIVDNRQFLEYDAFSRNPFSLLGETDAAFGGTLEFLSSGEFVWKDEGTEVNIEDNERRLVQGTVAIGGTFFPTSEDTEITNKLWFGETVLSASKASVLVNFDSKTNIATLVTGGGSIEIVFNGQEQPFVMPAHSQMAFNAVHLTKLDPYLDAFEFKKLYALQPVYTGNLVTKLDQFDTTVDELRSQFRYFALNLPLLWSSQNGPFLRFLEKISLFLPQEKRVGRELQELTTDLRIAREKIDTPQAEVALQSFKNNILSSSEWEKALASGEQVQREWRWFEFAQKFWLPVLTTEEWERKYSVLWSDDPDSLSEKMRVVTRCSYYEHWLNANAKLDEFIAQFTQTEFTPDDLPQVTRLRREMGSLLETYLIHRNLTKFKMWITVVRKEQQLLSDAQKEKISIEVGHDIVRFVADFLQKEEGTAIVQALNKLWFELDVPEDDESFSAAEKTTIENINLVGVTGMTPSQMRILQEQKAEQGLIEDQLIEIDVPVQESAQDLGISNAKKLWEFLAEKNVALDLASFRTTRTEAGGATTRFANTETAKRKIEGVFDYGSQSFLTLTLGEELVADLPAHQLGYWIKLIGGKFEPEKTTTKNVSETDKVVQTTSQAILGKKVVKQLLETIGVKVQQDQLEIIDKEYQRCAISNATQGNVTINAEYNLVTQEFENISLERAGTTISDIPNCGAEELEERIEALTGTEN